MKQRVLFSLMLALLLSVMVLTTGCAAPGMTKKDDNRRHINVWHNDMWQMQEDIDAFLLIDRPSRLSRMMVR